MPFQLLELTHHLPCQAGVLPLLMPSTSRDPERTSTRDSGTLREGLRCGMSANRLPQAVWASCSALSCPLGLISQKTFPSSQLASILSHSPRAALCWAGVCDRYHGVAAPGCGWTETGLHCRGISNWGRKEKDPIQLRERLGSKQATLKSWGSPKTHLPIFTACLCCKLDPLQSC